MSVSPPTLLSVNVVPPFLRPLHMEQDLRKCVVARNTTRARNKAKREPAHGTGDPVNSHVFVAILSSVPAAYCARQDLLLLRDAIETPEPCAKRNLAGAKLRHVNLRANREMRLTSWEAPDHRLRRSICEKCRHSRHQVSANV